LVCVVQLYQNGRSKNIKNISKRCFEFAFLCVLLQIAPN